MKSLRDLILSLLTALQTLFARRAQRAPRPVHGPAHPRIADARTDLPVNTTPNLAPSSRPARPALPPHLAALLARAPDVEPEFVRVRTPLHNLSVRLRIYNPRPPAPAPDVAPAATPSFATRAARALDPVTRWLVSASPSSRVRTRVSPA